MKASVISTMLADPECDPTSWLGDALISWIKQHPAKLLDDEVCRKYIIEGMDESDIATVGNGIKELFLLDRDIGVVEEFINHVSAMNIYEGGNRVWQIFNTMFYEVKDTILWRKIAQLIVTMKGVSYSPHPAFLSFLDVEDTKTILANWHTRQYEAREWKSIIDKFEGEELEYFLNQDFIRKLDKDNYASWCADFQDVLRYLGKKLPASLAKDFLKMLQDARIKNIWGQSEYTKDMARWVYNDGGEVEINDRLCPCGFAAKSPQGFTLHSNKCYDTDYGKSPQLYKEAAIRVAMVDPDSLICPGCAKQLKSKPGYTLHKKKCKPDPLYESIRALPR